MIAGVVGAMEIIPQLGQWIAGITAALITLALAPAKLVWMILMFVAITLTENHFLLPKVQSVTLGIHPAIIIVLLVLAAHFGGFLGMIVVVPTAAMVMEITRYLVRTFWKEPEAAAGGPPAA
jgi:predicted PurR-regulated permease PerM